MSDPQPKPAEIVNPETVVLRLFRCMEPTEQDQLIRAALEILGERCSFNPNYSAFSPEAIQQELEDDDLDSRKFAARPGSWPGQAIVELDNVGDPGDVARSGPWQPGFGSPVRVVNGRGWPRGVARRRLFADDPSAGLPAVFRFWGGTHAGRLDATRRGPGACRVRRVPPPLARVRAASIRAAEPVGEDGDMRTCAN
jgi:hypothetical protein